MCLSTTNSPQKYKYAVQITIEHMTSVVLNDTENNKDTYKSKDVASENFGIQ